MAKRQQKIRVVSYVHVGDELVCTDDLSKDQKKQLATWLKTTYLNSLFAGKAQFSEANETEKTHP